MDISHFDTALESCTNVIKLYEDLDTIIIDIDPNPYSWGDEDEDDDNDN